MNDWGPDKCEEDIDVIIRDMLPRALLWIAENKPWVHSLLPDTVEETGVKIKLKSDVKKAISLARDELKKMTYDGRVSDIPWREQNITSMGYHYYMTPETAQKGLDKLPEAVKTEPKEWVMSDWPDLRKMELFNDK